jgi:hypothetical protein
MTAYSPCLLGVFTSAPASTSIFTRDGRAMVTAHNRAVRPL